MWSRRVRSKGILYFTLLMAFDVSLIGCARFDLSLALDNVAVTPVASGFEMAKREPLNARTHMDAALSLLSRPNRSQADIQLAKSAFQTAARLAPDLWEPMVGLSAAHYRLGDYSGALQAIAKAVEIRGELGPLALPLALVAYRAQEPELAKLAFSKADDASGAGASFLTDSFAIQKIWSPRPSLVEMPVAAALSEERNVIIEAFMIRDLRSSTTSGGLNLLDSLALNFGGSIVNLTYDKGNADTSGDVSVSLPGVTYSLNLAVNDLSEVLLEATPLVIARQGVTSKFFEGGSVLIVPQGDGTGPVERNVGVILEVTPDRVGEDHVDLTVALELTNITGQDFSGFGSGAGLLQTDTTRIEAAARVPYQKAIIVGSAGSMTRRSSMNNSIFKAPAPGLSKKNSSALRRDVLALVLVRRPDEDYAGNKSSANDLALRIFNQPLANMESYGKRPSDTPDPQIERLLLVSGSQ